MKPAVVDGRHVVLRINLDELGLQLVAIHQVEQLQIDIHAGHESCHHHGSTRRTQRDVVQINWHCVKRNVINDWYEMEIRFD